MSTLEINIFGKPYSISCDNGHEKHLKELAVYLDRKVRSIASIMHQASSPSELHLMIVTALTIADELNDTTLEIAELKTEIEHLRALKEKSPNPDNSSAVASYQKSLENVAEKIESLAEELEKA